MSHPSKTVEVWLREQVANRERGEQCWEWPFGFHSSGYGQLKFRDGPAKVPGVVLILDGQPKPNPPKHHALHSCDNRSCFNPAHLRWGTHQDNIDDAVRRGRMAWGERAGRSRFTDDQIRAVLRDPRRPKLVGDELGVDSAYICRIRSGDIWKHLYIEMHGHEPKPYNRSQKRKAGEPYGEAL